MSGTFFAFRDEQKSLNFLNFLGNNITIFNLPWKNKFTIPIYSSQVLTLMKLNFRNTSGLQLDF